MLELHQLTIGDLGRVVTGRTPPSNRPDLLGNRCAFITPTDIDEGSIYANVQRRLSNAGEIENSKILLPPNTVCFTCIASIGKMCFTRELSITNQQINAIVVDDDRFDPRWVFYKLRGMRGEIAAIASGSATPIINKTSFSNIRIDVPHLDTQRRIGSILGAYDDLIEANRRRVAVLEGMAHGLFEEWFVRLRFPGHEDNKIIDTPDGPLPEGWAIRQLRDFGDIVTGKTPSKAINSNFGGEIGFVKIPDMHSVVYINETVDTLSIEGASTQSNKLIPQGSIIVSCIATLGLVSILNKPCQTNQQINAIVPYDPRSTEFLYFTCTNLKAHLQNIGSNGATMGNVNKAKFSSIHVLTPPKPMLERFHLIALPIFRSICNLEITASNLSASRDLLLPRLISGELSVAAAERALEAAA